MKKYLSFTALFLLMAATVIPLATLNGEWITLLPIYDNFNLENGIWEWRDISTFAITYPIIVILIFIFLLKEKVKVVYPLVGVAFFMMFFVLVSLWMTNVKVIDIPRLDFSFACGWIAVVTGFIITITAAVKKL